jgi:hypothetical protein
MSDPVSFYRTFIAAIGTYIQATEQLNLYQDRLTQDGGLAAAAAAAAQSGGRNDLATADFNNAANAIVQLNFTFNSGNPTQKSFLYKML